MELWGFENLRLSLLNKEGLFQLSGANRASHDGRTFDELIAPSGAVVPLPGSIPITAPQDGEFSRPLHVAQGPACRTYRGADGQLTVAPDYGRAARLMIAASSAASSVMRYFIPTNQAIPPGRIDPADPLHWLGVLTGTNNLTYANAQGQPIALPICHIGAQLYVMAQPHPILGRRADQAHNAVNYPTKPGLTGLTVDEAYIMGEWLDDHGMRDYFFDPPTVENGYTYTLHLPAQNNAQVLEEFADWVRESGGLTARGGIYSFFNPLIWFRDEDPRANAIYEGVRQVFEPQFQIANAERNRRIDQAVTIVISTLLGAFNMFYFFVPGGKERVNRMLNGLNRWIQNPIRGSLLGQRLGWQLLTETVSPVDATDQAQYDPHKYLTDVTEEAASDPEYRMTFERGSHNDILQGQLEETLTSTSPMHHVLLTAPDGMEPDLTQGIGKSASARHHFGRVARGEIPALRGARLFRMNLGNFGAMVPNLGMLAPAMTVLDRFVAEQTAGGQILEIYVEEADAIRSVGGGTDRGGTQHPTLIDMLLPRLAGTGDHRAWLNVRLILDTNNPGPIITHGTGGARRFQPRVQHFGSVQEGTTLIMQRATAAGHPFPDETIARSLVRLSPMMFNGGLPHTALEAWGGFSTYLQTEGITTITNNTVIDFVAHSKHMPRADVVAILTRVEGLHSSGVDDFSIHQWLNRTYRLYGGGPAAGTHRLSVEEVERLAQNLTTSGPTPGTSTPPARPAQPSSPQQLSSADLNRQVDLVDLANALEASGVPNHVASTFRGNLRVALGGSERATYTQLLGALQTRDATHFSTARAAMTALANSSNPLERAQVTPERFFMEYIHARLGASTQINVMEGVTRLRTAQAPGSSATIGSGAVGSGRTATIRTADDLARERPFELDPSRPRTLERAMEIEPRFIP